MPNPYTIQRFGDLRIETRPNRYLVEERDPQTLEWERRSSHRDKNVAIAHVKSRTRTAIEDLKRRLEEAQHDLRVLDWMTERDRSA